MLPYHYAYLSYAGLQRINATYGLTVLLQLAAALLDDLICEEEQGGNSRGLSVLMNMANCHNAHFSDTVCSYRFNELDSSPRRLPEQRILFASCQVIGQMFLTDLQTRMNE